MPATLAPEELLRRLDNGGDATVGLETIVFEEPTCETGEGLDELGCVWQSFRADFSVKFCRSSAKQFLERSDFLLILKRLRAGKSSVS